MFEITTRTIQQVVDIVNAAGAVILPIYNDLENAEITEKADRSPVTQADWQAHAFLQQALAELAPEVPFLSEESLHPDYSVRQQWTRYWLVDPLDGTKEFIRGNGEFTVNVALIDHGVAVFGVVGVPVKGTVYWGAQGHGAYKQVGSEAPITICVRPVQVGAEPVVVVASRRHGVEAVDSLIDAIKQRYGDCITTHMGSSLKLCLIAEGLADFYPRLAPTCEWDTAAAQAVLESAGGAVWAASWKPLRYNQKPALLNPHFYAAGDANVSWSELLPE